MSLAIGIVGTSWWAEGMYLPLLKDNPQAHLAAICGRNRAHAEEVAARWGVSQVFTDYVAMIEQGGLDGLIVATPNDTHYPITMKALEAGLHVLVEKPVAMNYTEAKAMLDLASRKGVCTFVPFTWSFTPAIRMLKDLIGSGYIGKPYHCNLRYIASYGRGLDYMWRLDTALAGSGVMGDLGSHTVHIARWLFGEIEAVSCHLGQVREHARTRPDGSPYEQADDSAILILDFANGAQGSIHLSMVAQPGMPSGQLIACDFFGSEGSLYSTIDYAAGQEVRGVRVTDPPADQPPLAQIIPFPPELVSTTEPDKLFEDMLKRPDVMVHEWVNAILEKRSSSRPLEDGVAVQRVLDAALLSHQAGRRVKISEID